jgi:hypothetical protein
VSTPGTLRGGRLRLGSAADHHVPSFLQPCERHGGLRQRRGAELYLAGTCTAGPCSDALARWDGTTLRKVGSGVNGQITALAVFDDGTGPLLYVAGSFSAAGIPNTRLATWMEHHGRTFRLSPMRALRRSRC